MAPENFRPRPRELNRPDCRAGPDESERQSRPPRAIRPINSDCKDRGERARILPPRIRPNRSSNWFSSFAIREDMRQPDKRLKYLASERGESAVPCVGKTAQSFGDAGGETDSLPEKRCAGRDIAAFLRRAEIRFILPSPARSSLSHSVLTSLDQKRRERRSRAAPVGDRFVTLSARREMRFPPLRDHRKRVSRPSRSPVPRRSPGKSRHASAARTG